MGMKTESLPHDVNDRQPTTARGRPAGDREAKRMELLRAAMVVIARDGYAKASLRKVAKEAGYTTGAITYYFANKEDLARALVEKAFDRYDAQLEAIRKSGDVKVLLEGWMKIITGGEKTGGLVMTEHLAHARHEPAFAEIIAQRYARFRATMVVILENAQVHGTVRNDIAAEQLAEQLGAIGDGWMMMCPIEPQRFTPERARALIDGAVALIAPLPRAPQ